jgi:hypothetical protein
MTVVEMVIKCICLVAWFILGMFNLFGKKQIDKWDYGCCWVLMMVFLIDFCMKEWS